MGRRAWRHDASGSEPETDSASDAASESDEEAKEEEAEAKEEDEDEGEVARLLAASSKQWRGGVSGALPQEVAELVLGRASAAAAEALTVAEARELVDADGRSVLQLALLADNVPLVRALLAKLVTVPLEKRQAAARREIRAEAHERERALLFSGKSKAGLAASAKRAERELTAAAEAAFVSLLSKPDNDGWTAMHFAAQACAGSMRSLLDAAPALDALGPEARARCQRQRRDLASACDSTGSTPLHVAAAHGNASAVSLLIGWGADAHATDFDDCTPMDVADNRAVRKALRGAVVRDACDGLHGAARSLKSYLAQGEDVNERSGIVLRSALHEACKAGRLELVKALLAESGVKVDARDAAGWSGLHICAREATAAHAAVAEQLVARGAKADAKSNAGLTPLHVAVSGQAPWKPRRCIVRLLLRSGADKEARAAGLTPLLLAARKGAAELVVELVQSGCDLAATDNAGNNALHLACFHGHARAARVLSVVDAEKRRLSSSRNAAGRLPRDVGRDARLRRSLRTIWEAASEGDLDDVRRLAREQRRLGASATVDATVDATADASKAGLNVASFLEGYSPLHAAVLGPHMGEPLRRQLAAFEPAAGALRVVNFLLSQKEVFVDASDKRGCTALMHASRLGCAAMVRVLLQRGASQDLTDLAGNTALHWAYAFRRQAVLALLDESSGNSWRNHAGDTPVMAAGKQNKLLMPRLPQCRRNGLGEDPAQAKAEAEQRKVEEEAKSPDDEHNTSSERPRTLADVADAMDLEDTAKTSQRTLKDVAQEMAAE